MLVTNVQSGIIEPVGPKANIKDWKQLKGCERGKKHGVALCCSHKYPGGNTKNLFPNPRQYQRMERVKKREETIKRIQESKNQQSENTSKPDYIRAATPKARASRPPEARFTTPALVLEPVSEALCAPVLDAAASEFEPDALPEEEPDEELAEAPVDEAEADLSLVLAFVVMVEAPAVVEVASLAVVEASLAVVDASVELELADDAPVLLAVELSAEPAVAVAPVTLKRGR